MMTSCQKCIELDRIPNAFFPDEFNVHNVQCALHRDNGDYDNNVRIVGNMSGKGLQSLGSFDLSQRRLQIPRKYI